MDYLTLVAAGIMTLTVFVHVFMGGPEIMRPVHATQMPKVVAAVMDVIWHGITVTLAVIAAALFWLSWQPNAPLLITISAIQLGFAGLFLWYGLTRLGSLWPMPQWVVFLGVPALCLWASV